jgi:hypothetical protein
MSPRPRRIGWRTVFAAIPARLRAELPEELQAFRWNYSGMMAKASYGNRLLHYEIWVRSRLAVVELGLHFEEDALTNARLLGAFRARAKDVKRRLGPAARIDEWDRGWARVWEPFALEPVDEAYAERIRSRFVEYVRELEPILREELPNEVAWKIAKPRAARGSYSRASR